MTKDTQPFGHDDNTEMHKQTLDALNTTLSGPELIDHAIASYKPSHIFALFSGGHDSLCSTHRAMATGKVDAVVHCNTGIGLHLTRDFVRETCKRFDWPLIEVRANEDCGQDYEQLVLERGFPGPNMHFKMYNRLKERCIDWLERKHRQYTSKPRRRIPIAYISGCRSEESTRRMGHVQPLQHQGYRIWVAINHDWTSDDNERYRGEHNLPRNPAKSTMCMSGECLCGAYAHKPELKEWVFHHGDDPGVQKLLAIREKVLAKFPWDWDDEGPPAWWKEKSAGQSMLCDMEPEFEDFQHMCTKCNLRQEIAEDLEDKQ